MDVIDCAELSQWEKIRKQVKFNREKLTFDWGNRKLVTMADLEAVLADVSYLMAMEMSKQTPESSKKIILPDPRWEFLFFLLILHFFSITWAYFGRNVNNGNFHGTYVQKM